MAEVSVLVGAQWGDEGKGKWSDYLSQGAHVVARFQGGNNAGHTIYLDGEKLVLHQVPCGFGDNNQILALTAGVVVNPEELLSEVTMLTERVHSSFSDRILISENAFVITPWHIYLDKKSEENSQNPIGTTKRGIGPTYQDRVSRMGLKVHDYMDQKSRSKWLEAMSYKSEEFCEFYNKNESQWESFFEAAEKLKPFVTDVESNLRNLIRESNKKIFLEGAQGVLLDVSHGTYPYVTSSSTIASAAASSIGFDARLISKVYGVAKAYITRVGEGSFPTEDHGEEGKLLGDKGYEYGATTNRRRRCGWFDAVAMRYAQAINGFDSILLNKVDVLSGFKTLKIATAYESKEYGLLDTFPNSYKKICDVIPVYEEFAGWDEDVSHVESFEELPQNAQTYLKAIEELSQVKIGFVGNGPNKNNFIPR